MLDFDIRLVPEEGLALLTAPDTAGGPMYIADFRDAFALSYVPTGHFVGFSRRGGLKLGQGPLKMVDGIWTMQEYGGDLGRHKGVALTPEKLRLELIERVGSL